MADILDEIERGLRASGARITNLGVLGGIIEELLTEGLSETIRVKGLETPRQKAIADMARRAYTMHGVAWEFTDPHDGQRYELVLRPTPKE